MTLTDGWQVTLTVFFSYASVRKYNVADQSDGLEALPRFFDMLRGASHP